MPFRASEHCLVLLQCPAARRAARFCFTFHALAALLSLCPHLTQAHVFSRGKMHFFLATKKRPKINLLSTVRLAGRLRENKCVVITECQKLQADRKLNAQFTVFLDERRKSQKKFQLSVTWRSKFFISSFVPAVNR